MPLSFNHNAKSITLVLVAYSVLQIVLFATLKATSEPLSLQNKCSLFQISVGCQCLLLLESILATLTITSNSLDRTYKFISYLFLLVRVVSVFWIYLSEDPVLSISKGMGSSLKTFSLIVGLFETVIVYSQTRMIKKVQCALL